MKYTDISFCQDYGQCVFCFENSLNGYMPQPYLTQEDIKTNKLAQLLTTLDLIRLILIYVTKNSFTTPQLVKITLKLSEIASADVVGHAFF